MTLSSAIDINLTLDSGIEERRHEQATIIPNGNSNLVFDQELLQCMIQVPSLFRAKNQLQKVFLECRRDADLWQMVVTWLKAKATSLPPIDLQLQMSNLVPVSNEKIFSWLCLPLSNSIQSENYMATALGLLLHSFRALTNSELEHLEKTTSYGAKIGRPLDTYSYDFHSSRTLDVLAGLTHIQGDEVQFSHAQFRDFLITQAKNGHQAFKFAAEDGAKLAHMHIAIWCLEVMNKATSLDWLRCQTNDENLTLLESRQDLLSYAIMHWVQHIKAVGTEAMKLDLVKKFLEDQATLNLWTKAYWSHSNLATRGSAESFSALAIFAENAADQLLSISIDAHRYLPSFQKQSLHALRAAARSGHSQTVHILKAHQTFDREPLDDLLFCCFASRNLDPQITKDFLQLAKERPEGLDDPLAVLCWAAFYGVEDAVKILLPLVSDNCFESDNEASMIPIQFSFRGACIHVDHNPEIVRRLIAAASERVSSQHLQMACKLGIIEAIPFLSGMMSSSDSDDDYDEGIRPTWFHTAIDISVRSGQSHFLKQLLQVDPSKKNWHEADSLNHLTDAITKGKFKCFSELASHLGSETLRHTISSLLEVAIQAHATPIVQYLLGFSMITEIESISVLISYAVQEGEQAAKILEILVQEGLEICEKGSYIEEIITMVNPVIRSGNANLVSLLLEKGPSLDSPAWEKRYPLFYAAMRGKKDIVKNLLEAKADPNVIGDKDGWRPIHAAYDNPEILEMLLEAGASKSVNATDNSGKTALFIACRWGYCNSVRVLLKFGAEACCYVEQETELSIAVFSGKPEVASLLLEVGVNPLKYSATNLKSPLLHYCVRQNLVDLLKMLLSYNFDVNERDENGSVALHYIGDMTTTSVLEILIRRGASTNLTTNSGDTPLLLAIQCQNNEAVEYLLSNGADVNMPTGLYGTSLNMACYSGTLESVKRLVEEKANVNFNYAGLYGTPLHSAILRPDDDEKHSIIEYLLNRKELDLNQSTSWWGGYLGLASLCCNLNLLSTLTAKDSTKINEEDKIGRRSIHFALYRTLDHVKHLVSMGAEFETTDRMKRNALHFAVVSGRLDMVKYVLAKNADLVKSRDIDNWTPLMWAVRICGRWNTRSNNKLDIIKELLNHGADRTVEGEGLGRTWTAYELAWYYSLKKEIIDSVTPTPEELQRVDDKERSALWAYRMKSRKLKGLGAPSDSYCDACLMVRLRKQQIDANSGNW
jgi:ankyrin repeat protein